MSRYCGCCNEDVSVRPKNSGSPLVPSQQSNPIQSWPRLVSSEAPRSLQSPAQAALSQVTSHPRPPPSIPILDNDIAPDDIDHRAQHLAGNPIAITTVAPRTPRLGHQQQRRAEPHRTAPLHVNPERGYAIESLVFTSSRITSSCIASPRRFTHLPTSACFSRTSQRDRNIVRHDEQWPFNCSSWRKRSQIRAAAPSQRSRQGEEGPQIMVEVVQGRREEDAGPRYAPLCLAQ